jgi:exodeoxyribonuclease V alpha subunit
MEFTTKQKLAIVTAVASRRFILTGGAGSGKTTVLKAIVAAIKEANPEEVVCLCSPTGKAAARITEATGIKASTVHSACGFFPADSDDESLGKSDRPNLPARTATTVIVDEASMLDDALLAALCGAVRPDCRLILCGDPNQLPPVGAGYPFRDLVASGRVPHVHLDVCHRQDGRLLENCYQILAGQADSLVYDAGKGNRQDADWGVIECPDERIKDVLTKLFSGDECETALGIACEDLLVLTPLNKGDAGRVTLNRTIQKAYHESRGRTAPSYKTETENDQFVPGDRVIWLKNDKLLGLVNGDTGVVLSVGDTKAVVRFDGIGDKEVDVRGPLALAWVLTCHKAQGSQYRKVLVVQSGKHSNNFLAGIVNRSWVYTAATRSKEATFFLGSAKAFARNVATPAVDRRDTLLSQL